MQNYTIEHRAPKTGERYIGLGIMGGPVIKTASEDATDPSDVLVPIAPAWPDKPVIVIEKGEQPGPPFAVLPVVAIRVTGAPFAGAYRDEAGGFWDPDEDTITAWSEYVPDGSREAEAATERREYTADDLDTLSRGTCAWDEDGDVWQRRAASWAVAGGRAFHNPLREGVVEHLYSAPPEENR